MAKDFRKYAFMKLKKGAFFKHICTLYSLSNEVVPDMRKDDPELNNDKMRTFSYVMWITV